MLELLIIDDDRAFRRSLELHMQGRGFSVRCASNLAEGESAWREKLPNLVFLDLMLPDGEGTWLLERMTEEGLGTKVIIITGHHEMERAVTGMRAGAFDFVHKPLSADELDKVVDQAIGQLQVEESMGLEAGSAAELSPMGSIIGRSRSILALHKTIGLASRGRANVLILGESGTGKELVARAIHRLVTPREPFLAVNCSALVPSLLESELFGHERGAFTGAAQQRRGRMELVGEGVLFLDEIGDLPLDLQAKLLRVIQEREFERVGGTQSLPFKAMLISATHRDLSAMVAAGDFREDLFYRLKVVEIEVEPLRDRVEDIPLLVEHFLTLYNGEFHRNVTRVPQQVLADLQAYHWPGNVRELENRIQAGIMASPGDVLTVEIPSTVTATGDGGSWRRPLRDVECAHIARVLEHCNWVQGEACSILGVSRPTLRKKIQDFGLKRPGKES
ncbi:MAG: sigma-54-dependent Fis family transcriptional regulator [bacterium]|nr:sigma-54-dependent Fis family transcriptional regulator [bacterium]